MEHLRVNCPEDGYEHIWRPKLEEDPTFPDTIVEATNKV